MKRSALKRKSRLNPRRSSPRKSGRVLWSEYLEVVRTLSCYVCGKPGPSDPDHMGPHPYGRKADDDTAVPLDRWCHEKRQRGMIALFEDGVAPLWHFVGGASEDMRIWCSLAIRDTRAIVLPILTARGVKNPKEET